MFLKIKFKIVNKRFHSFFFNLFYKITLSNYVNLIEGNNQNAQVINSLLMYDILIGTLQCLLKTGDEFLTITESECKNSF